MSTSISFLVYIGLRGVQPYAPLWVMCQLARVQEVPPNDDMSRFVFDTPLGFAFDSQDILKILFGRIISEQMVPGYLSWFYDPVTFGDTPEGSNLEKAKATVARQEAQVQIERNHQLELQDVEGELKHIKGKLARLEEELDNRIHLA
ncbi:hypothetical protein R3W88_000830 [Solanum pinnatisectum]|uniref:Uncharacterized protein n=1 Tax=Solanum pinnatisectum TaxID=50273 RepID=A0AAV9MH08_9SOLN|nr:hypothetical protein R3W88_000830 [Solanum pinnatisectum]